MAPNTNATFIFLNSRKFMYTTYSNIWIYYHPNNGSTHTRCHRNKFVRKGSLGLNEQWYILRKVSVRKRLAPKFMLFINGIHSHIGFIRRRGEEEGQTPKK